MSYIHPVKMLSSDFTSSAIKCAYNRLAIAPPAECPVMSSEQPLRDGSSSKRDRNRAATGFIILRATERKPEWQRFPGSSFGKLDIDSSVRASFEMTTREKGLTRNSLGD